MTTSTHHAPATPRSAGTFAALLIGLIVAGCGTSISAGAGTPAATTAADPSIAAVAPQPTTARTPTVVAPIATLPPAPTVPPPAAATPGPTPDPTKAPDPVPRRRAFAMNLYRSGDYVAQYTNEWCVGASLQMTLNMTTARTYASRASQRSLWRMAQARSFSPYGGANPRGWTATLNNLGVGPYVLVSIPTFDGALRVAAAAIRDTKRPVGLVMWRGRHAWVMSGFESIGDPRIHDDIEVTGIRVLDPLYPNGSAAWGPSPKPNALVKPATLARQFILRDRSNSSVDLGVPPGFLLVLPTKATA